MASPQHTKAVAAWLFSLASVCAGTGPIADLELKVRQIAEFLADDFPDAATFTTASVKAVATEVQFFPPYGKLKAFLDAWWQENRPQTQAPAGEPSDLDATDLPATDKSLVRSWQSAHHLPGNKTAVGDWVAAAWPGNVVGAAVQGQVPALVVDLSLIRRHAPAGYRWLLRTNQQAAQIAGKMGWTDIEHRRAAPTEEELAAVAERVGSLTNGAGQRIDDGGPRGPNTNHQAAAGRYAAQVEAERGRKLGTLNREALDAAWAKSGLQRPHPPPAQEAAE